jgi:hypothetical protein
MLQAVGKGSSEEEGNYPLVPSSTNVAGSFEQLNLNTQAQSVRFGGDAQLLLVSTTSDIGSRLFRSCCWIF